MARNNLCASKDKKNRWADRQIGLKPQPNSAKMTQFPWKEPLLRVFRGDTQINLRKTSVGPKASNGINPRVPQPLQEIPNYLSVNHNYRFIFSRFLV
jgi:hypothetical protein